ncbi:MAG: SRPBCC domain-containing protein [Pseudolabrys sp.]
MSELPSYVLERTFDAPREMVWRTWTEPKLLARWYGPNVETIVHRLDVRPGGLWLNEMKMGPKSMYQRAEYIEVVPPSRLVLLQSSSDAEWNIISAAWMKDWPRVMLTTVTFEADGDKTNMRLTWAPHEATAAEIACFKAALSGADKGWVSGMDALAKILAELKA